MDYVVVPLLLRISFGDKINFFSNAGPYWATLLKRKWVLEKAITLSGGGQVDEFDLTDNTEKSDYGIAVGIGASAVFNERIVISLEARHNMGMANINQESVELNTRTTLILAGVAFKFGSRENDAN